MTLLKTPQELVDVGVQIFDAAGSPHEESVQAMQSMVQANLAGHDSHGFLRVPFYLDRIETGQLKPGTPLEVERESRAMAVLNGNQGWGQVIARKAMQMAIAKARDCSVGIVSVRNSQHIGRLGEWVAMAAEQNMVGLAWVNSRGGQGWVAPWGGIERKLKPNPQAFACPSGEAWPVLVDTTFTVVAGGKIEAALFEGKQLPPGALIDAEGNPTTDPATFYGPPQGAMLPLGGPAGHKGYALNIMSDLMAGALTGSGVSGEKVPHSGNGVLFEAIHIADFTELDKFVASVQGLMAWCKSSRKAPGVTEILFPGEIEYRTTQRRLAQGIPIAEALWDKVLETGRQLGVTW